MIDDHQHIKARTILTGDRPTGPLHLGHYTGSLRARVDLQDANDQVILIADMQALTDNAGNPAKVRDNVLEVLLDYLAVGIDPAKSLITRQSDIPQINELTMLYLNLVSVGRLERNPTIKTEIEARGFGASVPAGFLCYPVSQAADITAFNADLVPAGADQAPLIELCNEIVGRVNRLGGDDVLRPAQLLQSRAARLPGIDGQGKMSKSAGNAILLSDSADDIHRKTMAMFTDPDHLRVSDPGKVEGNVVFSMLDAFDPDSAELEELKQRYRQGGLGDMALKRRLEPMLQEIIRPIRERRSEFARMGKGVLTILDASREPARQRADLTLTRVRAAFGLG